jgi:serine phosphatase RsbU (regulator of sigma subunit)
VPELEGWKISPLYRSAREVGGDFYNFNLLPEGRLGVVVGDATGKGVPAALVMSTTCGMLQLAAQALGSSSPGEVLAQVNEALVARIPTSMFVTCFYAILDPTAAA